MTLVREEAEVEAHHWKLFLQWPSSSSGAIRHVYLRGSNGRPLQCCLQDLLKARPRPWRAVIEVALDYSVQHLQLDSWDAIRSKAQINALPIQELHMHLKTQD